MGKRMRPEAEVVAGGKEGRPAHGPRRAYNFCVVLGRHYGLRLHPSPAQRRARAGPGLITSCWAQVLVSGKKSCFGATHGPRAFWPSIFVVLITLFS
jgi:hypothetical protein